HHTTSPHHLHPPYPPTHRSPNLPTPHTPAVFSSHLFSRTQRECAEGCRTRRQSALSVWTAASASQDGRRRVRHPSAHSLCVREKDRKSTRLNSSHRTISYAVFCL